MKNIEVLFSINESLWKKIIILKGEKERLTTAVKEKDNVTIDLRKVNKMFVGIIKKKDEMIAKTNVTLEATKEELTDSKSILKNCGRLSEDI